MDHTTLAPPAIERSETNLADLVAMHSLYKALQSLPNPRHKQGKRYELALVLSLVLAKLAGQTTLKGATEWIHHRGKEIATHFELHRTQMPCQMTYCRILAGMDAQKFDEVLAAFFIRWEAQQRYGKEPSHLQTSQSSLHHAHLAIDGKTVQATSKQAHPVHPLSCYDVTTGTLLWQCSVGEKQNEISALQPLITLSLVKGRIVTLDAMHTQRELCAQMQRCGGAYALIAKDNQPTLVEDIADLFADHVPDRRRWRQVKTWDKGHV